MSGAALAVHRAFYDAVETGDVDLMASLWVDDPGTSCVHPGADAAAGHRRGAALVDRADGQRRLHPVLPDRSSTS